MSIETILIAFLVSVGSAGLALQWLKRSLEEIFEEPEQKPSEWFRIDRF